MPQVALEYRCSRQYQDVVGSLNGALVMLASLYQAKGIRQLKKL